MSKHKLIVADSAALSNTTVATTMLKSDGSTYELVFPKYSLPVDSTRGCLLRIKAAVHATATHTTDTLATALQVGKTGTMTTVAATAAYDAVDGDVYWLEAEILFRSRTEFYSSGRGQYTSLTAPQLTFTKATALDWESDFRVQVQCTWSAASSSNSCKVVYLCGELEALEPNVTAALS